MLVRTMLTNTSLLQRSQRTWIPAAVTLRKSQRVWHAAQRRGLHTDLRAQAAPSDVFVLDFDGVLCDSEKEVSASAYDAAAQQWPQLFGGLSGEQQAAVKAGLRRTRPRLVEGYEAMVMARLILESQDNIERILADWDALLPATLAGWGQDPAPLASAFEAMRAGRMAGSQADWVALNPFFPGVPEAMRDCPYPFYVASSKKASRLGVLMDAGLGMEGMGEGSPRVFASLLPPNEKKAEALRTVMSRPLAQDPSTTLHFVEDRFETLHHISSCADLRGRWKLWLADWGYCTQQEKAAVAGGELPGVRPLSLPQFCELLRWGVVMGVDDGCEPTREEVLEGVVWKRPGDD